MIDKKYSYPALSNTVGTGKWTEGDAFSGVLANDYWSLSTTHVDGKNYAYVCFVGFLG